MNNIEELEENKNLSLPIVADNSEKIVINSDFYKMAFQYQEIMMLYESAIKQVVTKLEILNKEYKVTGRRNPIETIKSRIKTPESIAEKLTSRNQPVTFQSMMDNLNALELT